MLRHYHKLSFYEPKSKAPDHSKNDIPEDAKALAMLVGLTTSDKIEEDKETALLMGLDRGIDYAWDKAPLVSEVPWFQNQVVWFWH